MRKNKRLNHKEHKVLEGLALFLCAALVFDVLKNKKHHFLASLVSLVVQKLLRVLCG